MNVAIKWEGENGVPEDEGKVRQRQTERERKRKRKRLNCEVWKESLCAKMFFGLNLNREGEALTDSSECRPWGSPSLSALLSLCRSHMVGVFSQNTVTLTGLPMILPSKSDLTC